MNRLSIPRSSRPLVTACVPTALLAMGSHGDGVANAALGATSRAEGYRHNKGGAGAAGILGASGRPGSIIRSGKKRLIASGSSEASFTVNKTAHTAFVTRH